MRCPYCIEEIADEAIVCRWCGRDLAFFVTINVRVKTLEDRISEIENRLIATAANPTSSSNSVDRIIPPRTWSAFTIASVTLIAIMLDGLCGLIVSMLSPHGVSPAEVIPVALLASIPSIGLGIWLSYKQGIGWRVALPLGLSKLVFGAILYSIGYDSWNRHLYPILAAERPLSWQLNRNLRFVPSWYRLFLPSFATFLSSFWLGRSIAKRRATMHAGGQFSQTASGIGKALLTRGNTETQNTFDDRVRRLNLLIGALAPILTLVGSITVALLGLLSATQKGVTPK